MSDSPSSPVPSATAIGRGTGINTPNRFERIHVEQEYDHLSVEDQQAALNRKVPTEYFVDDSQSIVSENNSPDLPFRYSINPYRGCAHGCSYCYARPWHEFLGLSAGLDFESKILVKPDAPNLFRKWLSRPAWDSEPVNLSGITDPWQPAERKFEITRGCLQVAVDCRQPLYLITKNALIARDLDLVGELADCNLVRVVISVTSLDQSLIRQMEPRTSSPASRLATIEKLADRGVPVAVNVAPIIPGLNDSEIPAILKASAEAGARAASYIVLRLGGAVEPVFRDWLQQHRPDQMQKVLNGVRAMHDGQLADSRFGVRMSGQGALAENIRTTFKTFARHYGLDARPVDLDTEQFRRPDPDPRQQRLF